MTILSRTEEIILVTILKLEDNAYGVSIRQQIYSDTGKQWSFASIYQPLEKLSKKELVMRIKGEPTAERGGKSKFYYQVTQKGIKSLAVARKEYDQVWAGIPKMALENQD